MYSHASVPEDIRERTFAFSVRIVRLCKYLEAETRTHRNLITQLIRSGTSIGANLEEALAAQSKADFIHKNGVALKEARESLYWLRLLVATEELDSSALEGIRELSAECDSIARIVGKIIVKTKGLQ